MAIKEIQLSNIPKSEIGQIMVRTTYRYPVPFVYRTNAAPVRNRFAQESQRMAFVFEPNDGA